MSMRALVTTVVLALALGACGGEEETTGGPSGGGGGLSGPLQFLVTGGEAFREDRLTLQPDGAVRVQTRQGSRSATLTPGELSEVESQLDAAELGEIPEDSTTEPPMPDALGYGLVYEGREVNTDAGSMPERLQPLVGTFMKLLERYGAE
jgi:hypothetical protein